MSFFCLTKISRAKCVEAKIKRSVMKKLVTLACYTTLATVLSGCSGGSDTGTPPNTEPKPVPPPTAAQIVPLISLKYDEPTGSLVAVNSAGGQDFTISNAFDFAERAPGVLNTALRTDGYSTWAQGDLSLDNIQELTIQTWVALENYPADAEVPHDQLTPSSFLQQSSGTNGFNFINLKHPIIFRYMNGRTLLPL